MRNLTIHSLRDQLSFSYINQIGTKFYHKHYIMVIARLKQDIKTPKKIIDNIKPRALFLGFKISSKVAKAVLRNRMKRRLKPIISECASILTKDSCLAIITIPRKTLLLMEYKELKAEIFKTINLAIKKFDKIQCTSTLY